MPKRKARPSSPRSSRLARAPGAAATAAPTAGRGEGSYSAPGSQTARGADTSPSAAAESASLPGLDAAVRAWVKAGDAEPLIRWLDRTLDAGFVPRKLPVAQWPHCLASLTAAVRQREARWRMAVDARVERLVRAILQFSRPDGSLVFHDEPADPEHLQCLRLWADRLSDAGLGAVLDQWSGVLPQARGRRAAPPLPADARPDRPLAILRPDWSPRGDLLAIDQRGRSGVCLLELFGLGKRLLGPTWISGTNAEADPEPTSPPRPVLWKTGPYADLAEWSFRQGDTRVTRSALLLRGRQVALIAEQVDGASASPSCHIALAPGVTATHLPETRALMLSAARGTPVRVLPVGLPAAAYQTERGSLEAVGQALVLRQQRTGKRTWLPLVVSWRPERDRKPTQWRQLTVTERSRICRPDEAFAARVSWGASENLVIYRSLARPTRRAFLGHQTEARFLVGLFSKEGVVEPLLAIEDE